MNAICKKAFVTGGSGFIGSHVVDSLLVRDEVMDLPTVQKAMAGCDFVFHFQANADVRSGKQKPRIDLEQNTLATWNVLEAMRINEVKRIAFASSAAVYG